MNIVNYIRDLLYEHDCVIIPEFGAFVGNPQPARVDKYLKTYYQPTKKLTFNRLLNSNDGILANAVAIGEVLSYDNAIEAIKSFVEECSNELTAKNSLNFEDIGRLYLNKEEKLIFISEYRSNFLLDSFGLHNIRYQIVEHHMEDNIEEESQKLRNVTNDVTPQQLSTEKEEPKEAAIVEQPAEPVYYNEPEPRIDWKWLRIAAVFFVIVTFVNLILFDKVPNQLRLNEFSIFNLGVFYEEPSDNLRDIELVSEKTDLDDFEIVEVTEDIIEPKLTDYESNDDNFELDNDIIIDEKPWENFEGITLISQSNKKSGFYIIVGSFSQDLYANNAISKYSNNYEAAKLTAPNGFTRIGLYVISVEQENVKTELSNVRNAVNSSAWLVYNKTE